MDEANSILRDAMDGCGFSSHGIGECWMLLFRSRFGCAVEGRTVGYQCRNQEHHGHW